MAKRLSKVARIAGQQAAADVYVKQGWSLDKIEQSFPELAEGIKELRKKSPPKPAGSGPGTPVSSRPDRFS